ncbi:MAG: class I SAM-dependent methyltransferase, partial [Arthrobacter sp.]
GNIKWVRQDLATWVPEELFDLVTAQFLHSTVMPWQQALQLAAAAVRTGGTLLIVGHHPAGLPPWRQHAAHHAPDDFYTAAQLASELRIEFPEWRVDVSDARQRGATGPDGEAASLTDAVLRATRLTAR